MEDGDISLEKEIEELTLDRPPVTVLSFGGTETVVEDIFKDVTKVENESETIISSRLANCLIDKPLSLSCQVQQEDQDVTFDPLSSSEKNFTLGDSGAIISDVITELGHGYGPDDSNVNEKNALHSSDIEQIHVLSSSIHLVQSQSESIESKSTENSCPSKCTSPTSREKLVSCLKDENTIIASNAGDKVCTKCVRFTDEPGIVTEFIEPVNPWRDMRTPSKGEVISLYKNVCKKMKCKPLDKVVKQIQDIHDLSARSGTLVLRGCRLDNKSCEALESVFKRVQFENLDLENCSLEEDGATAILEMIEFYHSTCKLNIACNPKVGLRGWQALCRMLRKTPCLTYLDARRTILTEMTMPTFGRCLKADPYLKVLHLEGVFLSGRPLLILTTALKYNRLLEELYLGDNDLTSNDGPSLGAMLTYNTTLQLLDLRNNQIKDIGLAHIGNGLSDQTEQPCGGLCSLIMWNNGLTHEGMSYLCEGLVKTTTLKALNLGQNRIGDLGVQKLKGGLIKNKSLRKLGFLNTKLGSEGAVALAEVLADSWSITRIDVRENNIQTAGLMAFAMALKVNQSLLRLDLDKDIRKEPGMETVMQSVLVDIYNLCHRNKNLSRKNVTPSQSTSSCSIGTVVSRQSSTSSEMNEPLSFDDVFHPEAANQEVTPYSPTVCIDNPLDSNAGIMFSSINTIVTPPPVETETDDSTESLGNSVSAAFEQSIKRGRAYSDPLKNNPDPAPNDKRGSRFSVTKILDSLGTHAQGVASKFAQIDTKLKRQSSKERMEVNRTSELVPVLDQNEPIELSDLKSAPVDDGQDQDGAEPIHGNIDTDIPVNTDTENTDVATTEKPEDINIEAVSTESDVETSDEPMNTDAIIRTEGSTETDTTADTVTAKEPVCDNPLNMNQPDNSDSIDATESSTTTDVISTDACTASTEEQEIAVTETTEQPTNTGAITIDEPTNDDSVSSEECSIAVAVTTEESAYTDTVSTCGVAMSPNEELSSNKEDSNDERTTVDTTSSSEDASVDSVSINEVTPTYEVNSIELCDAVEIDDREHAGTGTIDEGTFTSVPDPSDNVSVIHDESDVQMDACLPHTDNIDTHTNETVDKDDKHFDSEVTSTFGDDGNATDIPTCTNFSATLPLIEHPLDANTGTANDISEVLYKEQPTGAHPIPDACQLPSDACDVVEINYETSESTSSPVEEPGDESLPDRGSMENLLLDDHNFEDSSTSCDSGATSTKDDDDVDVHHCVGDVYENAPSRVIVSEDERDITPLRPDLHDTTQEDCVTQEDHVTDHVTNLVTDINFNDNIIVEPTLLDSVVKSNNCISLELDRRHKEDEVHDEDDGGGDASLECEDATENESESSTPCVGQGDLTGEEGTSRQCCQATDVCLPDADDEGLEQESLVNVQLEISPVISTAINDNLDMKLNQGDVDSLGLFSQHTVFGQAVSVDLPT